MTKAKGTATNSRQQAKGAAFKRRAIRKPKAQHATGASSRPRQRRYRYEQIAVEMLDETFGPCDAKRTETIDLRVIGRVNMAALDRAVLRGASGGMRRKDHNSHVVFTRRVEFDWIRRPHGNIPGIVFEVDGAQHQKSVARFGGWSGFVGRVESDHDKHHWALANGYKVARVSNTAFGDAGRMCGEEVFRTRMRHAIASLQRQVGQESSRPSTPKHATLRQSIRVCDDDDSDHDDDESDVSVEQPPWPGAD